MNLHIERRMIDLLSIKLCPDQSKPCHCAAKRERHIPGNRQETAEGWRRGSKPQRNQVSTAENLENNNFHVIFFDFQGYCRRWRCSKELLLQQITLV